jgi:hypothetical protein
MTAKEAAALVGKSTDTVYRWKRAGLDIQNVAELLKHSARQDENACGRSFELQLKRGSANGATHGVLEETADVQKVLKPSASQYVPEVEGDEYIDLPVPFRMESGRKALALLKEMESDCARRLTGCRLGVELAQEDLDRVTESRRLLEITVEGWALCAP